MVICTYDVISLDKKSYTSRNVSHYSYYYGMQRILHFFLFHISLLISVSFNIILAG